jgi:hypothetical protein
MARIATAKAMKRSKKSPSPYESFAALSDAQKEAVYQKFDDPDVALKSKPMTPRMKKLWNRAKSKGGRRPTVVARLVF